MTTNQNNRGDAEAHRSEKMPRLSNGLLAFVGSVALLLAILLGWQSWSYARLKIEVAFAEEQTRIFDTMLQQAVAASPAEAAGALAYVVNYYPSGTKQRRGSRLDKVVERAGASVIRGMVSELREKTGEDLGTEPEAWIERYAKNK